MWTATAGLALALTACGSEGDLTVFNDGPTDVTVTTGDEEFAVPASGGVSVLGGGCTDGDVTVRFATGPVVVVPGPVCPEQQVLVGDGTAELAPA